jgi:hypothetical protein
MRHIIPFLLFFILLSCEHQKENKGQKPETPKALQENKQSSLIEFSKRISDDLVDDLYEEKLDEVPELKTLDKKFNALNKSKIDSLAVFHKFDSKNLDYYRSVNAHLNRVQDSFLKNELKTFFENNEVTYTNSVSRLKNLEDQIGKQYISAIDRRIALKLFVTLNMMAEFRKSNMPPASSLESVVNNYKTYNSKLDSAITKNK